MKIQEIIIMVATAVAFFYAVILKESTIMHSIYCAVLYLIAMVGLCTIYSVNRLSGNKNEEKDKKKK